LFNALQPNFAWSLPEKDTGTPYVEPTGTPKEFGGTTAAVFVGLDVTPAPASPLILVTPSGTPPPPPEFASAALLTVTCVSLSIDTILVPTGNALPELTNKPTARLSVFVTVIVFCP